jgi:hypothetical protein
MKTKDERKKKRAKDKSTTTKLKRIQVIQVNLFVMNKKTLRKLFIFI